MNLEPSAGSESADRDKLIEVMPPNGVSEAGADLFGGTF